MPLQGAHLDRARKLLIRIIEFELAGVVLYTHHSLMVTGLHRLPIVQFMKQQATESLLHAQQAGELLTGLDGHPSLRIAPIKESYQHSVEHILQESAAHEAKAIELYEQLLQTVVNRSVYLEEYARTHIGQEEVHMLELQKMLRDIGLGAGAGAGAARVEAAAARRPRARRTGRR